MTTQTATDEQLDAYDLGKSHQGWQDYDEYGCYNPAPVPDRVMMRDDLRLFYEAGTRGGSMPVYVVGWRYGSLPAGGRSTNFRDGHAEPGVSLMAVGELGTVDNDGTFALFNDGRPIVRVGGWFAGRGSDGEPCVVGAVELN